MEKSIESIWKKGFFNSDVLAAPKQHNLNKQKSIHIIDKFKRMFRINLYAIVVASILVLGFSFLNGMLFMGTGVFLTLSIIVIVNRSLFRELNKIDISENSYRYIKAFDSWMKHQIRVNRIMARFYYPLLFLSVVLGFWNYHFNGNQLGETITNMFVLNFPGTNLIFGVPLLVILGVVLIMVLVSFLGGRIYDWDFKVIYGAVVRKLEEIIGDMEQLRN
jgi:hypothetical protein